ncbi:hypothetical protein [Amycolatopsis albispora]|uniref:DUF3558 domain-containing protein n=1 Tax=Amycolatopsis albispora TaxID=1804986 RepID=A0A344LFV6_9PSEU|nr:hypothetical protein [Amycolatopsis albispora]AXB46930.1 hypothetical protein A4R43_34495 [Amycolatopsis albispora]
MAYQQPPGWGPPPGYGYPPQQPPKKKSRLGLVLGLVFGGLLLLGIAIPLVLFTVEYNESVGSAASPEGAAPECRISQQVTGKYHAPNLSAGRDESSSIGLRQANCGWAPSEDETVHFRSVTLYINQYTDSDGEQAAAESFESTSREPGAVEIEGIGDRAFLVPIVNSSSYSGAEVRVLQGNTQFSLSYSGWDKEFWFFGTARIPQQQAEEAARAYAGEIAGNLRP